MRCRRTRPQLRTTVPVTFASFWATVSPWTLDPQARISAPMRQRIPSQWLSARAGAELPRLNKRKFDAFLGCGILAHGFLRLRCGACGHDKLLAFSCKRRGFCPSCGARRMSQNATHPVDRVIAHVPVRRSDFERLRVW